MDQDLASEALRPYTLRPRQNGRHFADDMFKCIFLNENLWIPIEISLKFVLKGSIDNNPALFQIMAWRRPGDKPLSETMMVNLLTHICVTRPQWVKSEEDYVRLCMRTWSPSDWDRATVLGKFKQLGWVSVMEKFPIKAFRLEVVDRKRQVYEKRVMQRYLVKIKYYLWGEIKKW